MSDEFVDTPEDRPDDDGIDWQTLIAAVLLGIAATLTALSAYQAALTDGDALKGYTKSNTAISDSNFFYQQGNGVLAADQALFTQWVTANQEAEINGDEGKAAVAEYLMSLMRPELTAAIEWWIEQPDEVALTPFDDVEGNPYVVDDFAEGEAQGVVSKEEYDKGAKADDKGDKFELSTVLLALTLFFGGIATLFRRSGVTYALLGIGLVSLAAGVVQMLSAFQA